jgi:4-aminobutyrate aminotransferase
MIPVNVRTKIPGPLSQQMVSRAMDVIARAQYAGLFGIAVTSGNGAYLTDADGNTYLDFLAGASAVSVGYGRKEIIDVYAKTAAKIQHSCFPYSPNEEATDFANKLIDVTPGDFEKRILFGLSGSDGVDAAIKIARKFTSRPRVISFRGGYHGSTGFSLSANGFEGLQKGLFISENFVMADFPRTPEAAENSLDAIETLLKQDDVAVVLTECIQGDGGNVVPPSDFHQQLAELTHRYGSIFVVDEVQSGAGRSGEWWECQTYGVVPDIICTGKAITSGYIPMSACIANAEMAQTLDKAQHLFTYSGHPPSAAVGSKVFEIIENENLRENAKSRGEQLRVGLQKLVDKYPFAKEVRGKGLHMGFEVFDDPTNTPLGGLFAFRCVEKGIYPGYFGSKNEVMRLHPPLIISEEEMAFAVDVLTSVVQEWADGNFPEETIQNYRTFGVGLGTD